MLSHIINGLAVGGGYALAAVGLSYTIGTTHVLNFAYGSFYMLGAFVLAYLLSGLAAGIGYVSGAVLAIAVVAALGILFARVAVVPLIEVSHHAVVLSTLGVSVLLTNLALLLFGSQVTLIQSPFSQHTYQVGATAISAQELLLLGLAPVATGLLVRFMKTSTIGLWIRATAQDPRLAATSGVPARKMQIYAVTIGVAFAALAGVLNGPTGVMSVFVGDHVLLKAFAAATLAGMGHLWAALFVGLTLGVGESLFGAYVSTAYSEALVFLVIVVTFTMMPNGLFGHRRQY